MLTLVSLLCLLVFAASLMLQAAENDNEANAVWRTVVYVTSGMDVDPPHSTVGQLIAVMVLIGGVHLCFYFHRIHCFNFFPRNSVFAVGSAQTKEQSF